MKIWAKTDGAVKEGKYLVVRRDGTIPEWGHFVMAEGDPAVPAGLRAYAAEARRLMMDEEYCASIESLADDYDRATVQRASDAAVLGVKGADPDAGPHRKDNPAVVEMMRGNGDLSVYAGRGLGPTTYTDEEIERAAIEHRISHLKAAWTWVHQGREPTQAEMDELQEAYRAGTTDIQAMRAALATLPQPSAQSHEAIREAFLFAYSSGWNDRMLSIGLQGALRANDYIASLPPSEPLLPGCDDGMAQIMATRPLTGAGLGEGFSPDDGDGPVNFYERDFYPLSNFSTFEVMWSGSYSFKSAEHCYHWLRFASGPANGKLGGVKPTDEAMSIADAVRRAPSAHEAFKIAQDNKYLQRADWDAVKVEKMRLIIHAKADQHEYVRRKLLATGDRLLVEGSWRDDFWGAGADGKGQNMLGKLWMELRSELRGWVPR